MEDYSDYDGSTDDEGGEYVYDQIGRLENYGDKEYQSLTMLLGFSYYDTPASILLASTITNSTFHKFSYHDCYYYLYHNSVIRNDIEPKIDIMHLHIKNPNTMEECYEVVVKTFWLKLVQRTWRNVLKKRKQWLAKNASIFIRQREITNTTKTMPYRLNGMLSYLKVSK